MRHIPTLLITMGLMLPGCHGRTDEAMAPPENDVTAPAASNDPLMRTYTVPTGRSEEVTQVLRRALSGGKDAPPRGTVSQLDDGRLVVLAPASVHEGIAGLCEDLEQVGPAPTPPTVEISYWLVVAQPGQSEVAATLPDVLAPALEEIATQDGPAGFSLLESTRIRSLASTQGEARGRHAEIEQVATVVDDAIVADIEIGADAGSRLETRLSLQPGELVVIGHAGRHTPEDTGARLYYIVRAQTV